MRATTLDRASPLLHDQARAVRDDVFGRRVFVRGVVEVSNHCRENCRYCAMRRDNRALTRYRLVEAGCHLSRVGIAEHLRNAAERVLLK